MKSFRANDQGGPEYSRGDGPSGRNAERDFRGERRSIVTHASTTDPDARLFKKTRGQTARQCHIAHVLMEKRHGLLVLTELTHGTRTAIREAALTILECMEEHRRITLGADTNYSGGAFVAALREIDITPQVARNTTSQRSAIEGGATRDPGYDLSPKIRKRIEEVFGWVKTYRTMGKTRHRGQQHVGSSHLHHRPIWWGVRRRLPKIWPLLRASAHAFLGKALPL